MDVWEFHETFECRAWPANDRHKLRQAKEQSKDWTAKSERGRSEIVLFCRERYVSQNRCASEQIGDA